MVMSDKYFPKVTYWVRGCFEEDNFMRRLGYHAALIAEISLFRKGSSLPIEN